MRQVIPFSRTNMTLISKHFSKLIYQLKVVQHPSRARMCGFGDKDRRSIVPTPIIQLLVKDEDGSELDSK